MFPDMTNIPESLVEKIKKVMEESDKDEKPSSEEDSKKKKGEKITFNPEIRPVNTPEPNKAPKTN